MVCAVGMAALGGEEPGRRNLRANECTGKFKAWTCPGGVAGWKVTDLLLLVGAILYLFCGIAIICDDFFEASLEKLSEAFELSEDVAGATFMAAGSSAPELFTSLSATFGGDPTATASVGPGTITGSAVFNILVIIGMTALSGNSFGHYMKTCDYTSGTILQIKYKPLLRDAGFYSLAIGLLCAFVWDEEVFAWEAAIMLIAYGMYLVFMKFNARILGTGDDGAADVVNTHENAEERRFRHSVQEEIENEIKKIEKETEENATLVSAEAGEGGAPPTPKEGFTDDGGDEGPEDEPAEFLGFEVPDETGDKIFFFLTLPWYLAFRWTVPNCEEEDDEPTTLGSFDLPKGRWYWMTFFTCIFWIGFICFMMVESAIIIGEMLGISPAVMGLSVLAAGTSVPDALASIAVAKRGFGDMAVSNALGSNVFDILLGLGFPWFLANLLDEGGGQTTATLLGLKKADGAAFAAYSVVFCTADILIYVITLYIILVIVLATFKLYKFQLRPILGLIFCLMYVVFLVGAILFDQKAIFPDADRCAMASSPTANNATNSTR